MKVIKQSVGIDVSKESLSCCFGFLDHGQKEHFSKPKVFANTKTGFKSMRKWVKENSKFKQVQYVMEATGVYYENLAYWLFDKNEFISVLLPSKVNHFTKTLEIKTKTDSVDAKVLSKMGLERKLRRWTVSTPVMRQIKALTREYRENKAKLVVSKNQLHAKTYAYKCPTGSLRRLKRQIALIERQLTEIEAELRVLVIKDSSLEQKIERLESIPGVGFMTIVCILGETNGFALVSNGKQLASYAGLDVKHKQSGKMEGKSRISKRGNTFIRNALYMPALCSTMHNSDMKGFYHRVNEGKSCKKVGVTAVARKLLILIYTLWKNNTEYIPNYQSI